MNPFLQAMLLSTGAVAGAPAEDELTTLRARVEVLEARLTRMEQPARPPPAPQFGADLVVPVDARWEEAVAWSGDVQVLGAVSGPVVAFGGDVWLGPDARVEGHLVSLGGHIDVHPDAVVLGDRVGLGPMAQDASVFESLARRLSFLLGMAAIVVLQVNLAEDRTRNIADTIRQAPGWYAVGGGILAVAALVTGTTAMLSVLAAPLGIAVFAALTITLVVGMAGVCRFLGDSLPGTAMKPWAAGLCGAVIVGILVALPTIGPFLAVLAGFVALGAGALSRLGRRAAIDI